MPNFWLDYLGLKPNGTFLSLTAPIFSLFVFSLFESNYVVSLIEKSSYTSKQTCKKSEENSCPENFAEKILKDRNIQNYSYGFLHSPNPEAAAKLQRRLDVRWKRRRASIIARSKRALSPTRLCER
jgi:hypothetical protein